MSVAVVGDLGLVNAGTTFNRLHQLVEDEEVDFVLRLGDIACELYVGFVQYVLLNLVAFVVSPRQLLWCARENHRGTMQPAYDLQFAGGICVSSPVVDCPSTPLFRPLRPIPCAGPCASQH